MILKLIVFLLSVQAVISAKLIVETVDTLTPSDNLSYGLFKTPIFSREGVSYAQPVITMEPSCPVILYKSLEQRVIVDEDPLKTLKQNFTGISGKFTLDPGGYLKDRKNKRFWFQFLYSSNNTNLTAKPYKLNIKCATAENCYKLWAAINSNISEVSSLSLNISGKPRRFGVRLKTLKFIGVHIATPVQMKLNCSWTVVQIRDHLLGKSPLNPSFWNNSLGFGEPEANNYWIGLNYLHLITDKKDRPNHKCKLRIEVEDWKGNRYWGQWNQFQVTGPKYDYQLKVGEEVDGTLIDGLDKYKMIQYFKVKRNDPNYFSYNEYENYIVYYKKYLSRNSTNRSCSNSTLIGWWLDACFSVNINGNYKTPDTKPNFNWVPMKKSVMKVNCG